MQKNRGLSEEIPEWECSLPVFKLTRKLIFTGLAASLSACSILNVEPGEQLPAGAFRGTAAIRHQTIPLPVEIATDIEQITAEGQVKTESQKKPTDSAVAAATVVPPEAPKGSANPVKEKADMEGPVAQVRTHPLSGRQAFSRRPAGKGRKGGTENYQIRPGDTLMKISFAKYGDIYRWREIFEANRNVLKNFNLIPIGAVIVIHGVEFVVIEKNGEPYLIRRGDTLKKIAGNLYGDSGKWRVLWQNNRKLIRNPDRIYAGFTIYYPSTASQDPEGRDPARDTSP